MGFKLDGAEVIRPDSYVAWRFAAGVGWLFRDHCYLAYSGSVREGSQTSRQVQSAVQGTSHCFAAISYACYSLSVVNLSLNCGGLSCTV
jgi:hypothetical protein